LWFFRTSGYNHEIALSLKQNGVQYAQLKVVIIRTNNKDETPRIVFHANGKIILKDQHLI
jgi:hypothetical protein